MRIKPPENDQMNNTDHSQVVLLFFLPIQPLKEIIIGAGVDLLQGNQYADADVQLAGFVFFIRRSADVTASALELRAQLFL